MRRLAAELTKGKTTRDDKLKALFEFVADDIRYVNYVSGEWWLPNRPQQLLARRQGDCDDKAILLITLLKAVGIEATEVLVQTRYTGAALAAHVDRRRPSRCSITASPTCPGRAARPGSGSTPRARRAASGPLPSMDARALALYVSRGPADDGRRRLRRHPTSTASTGPGRSSSPPSGAGDLDATERHIGDHAFVLRTNLARKTRARSGSSRTSWRAGFPRSR